MTPPRIVIGITGGIAAYKVPHLIRLLRKQGAEVKVVLTRNALSLVGGEALRTLSGHPIYSDESTTYDMDHIRLTKWADYFLIAPATANTIAKIALGIADNLLTTLACAFPSSNVLIAPAMNSAMWKNSATQENVKTCLQRQMVVLPVGYGELACGDEGAGRMAEVEDIVACVVQQWRQGKPLSGKRVLISSGPTEEPIDPVRVITNRSSGKMGTALAFEALRLGAEVTVVSGPAVTPLPEGVTVIPVRTTTEMEKALHKNFSTADICIMAAAVCDYHPVQVSMEKLRREEKETLSLDLAANSDILAGLGAVKKEQLLVGFALESSDDRVRAEEKMRRKKCDIMVLNQVATALGSDATDITIIDVHGGSQCIKEVTKADAAKELFSYIEHFTGNKNG